MGNYKDIEVEFVERTLKLISQYESILNKFEFSEQYNYTLLLNCMLGLIVVPKETNLSHIPTDRLTTGLKKDMGLVYSTISEDIHTLRDLIIGLRHSISHFNIAVTSDLDDEKNIINHFDFFNDKDGKNYLICRFYASELLPILRYYGSWYISNKEKFSK